MPLGANAEPLQTRGVLASVLALAMASLGFGQGKSAARAAVDVLRITSNVNSRMALRNGRCFAVAPGAKEVTRWRKRVTMSSTAM